MTKQDIINGIESRQLELLGVMRASDAHASKCAKLGLVFRDEYPEDYAAYTAAREEYNDNEEKLAEAEALPDDGAELIEGEEL